MNAPLFRESCGCNVSHDGDKWVVNHTCNKVLADTLALQSGADLLAEIEATCRRIEVSMVEFRVTAEMINRSM